MVYHLTVPLKILAIRAVSIGREHVAIGIVDSSATTSPSSKPRTHIVQVWLVQKNWDTTVFLCTSLADEVHIGPISGDLIN